MKQEAVVKVSVVRVPSGNLATCADFGELGSLGRQGPGVWVVMGRERAIAEDQAVRDVVAVNPQSYGDAIRVDAVEHRSERCEGIIVLRESSIVEHKAVGFI